MARAFTLNLRDFMRIAPRNYRWLNPSPDHLVFTFDDSLVDGTETPCYTNPEHLGAWYTGYLAGVAAAEKAQDNTEKEN